MLRKILGLTTTLLMVAPLTLTGGDARAQSYGNAPYGNAGNADYGNGGYNAAPNGAAPTEGGPNNGSDYGNPPPAYEVRPSSRFYFEGSLGILSPTDVSHDTTFTNRAGLTTYGHDKTTYDIGPSLTVGLGYRLMGGLRLGAELGYGHFSTSTLHPRTNTGTATMLNGSGVSTLSGGDNNLVTMTVAAYYDLPISQTVKPYLGIGGGWYHLDAGALYFADSSGANLFSQSGVNSDNGMFLGEIGVSIAIDSRWSVVPSYRYEHLFTSSGPAMDLNLFKVGARYNF